jgi:putative hydrolase of the HAD superfamily
MHELPPRYTLGAQASRRFWLWVYDRLLAEAGLSAPQRAGLAEACLERFLQHETWRLFPDVLPVLDQLHRQGYRLGIISNWEDWLETVLVRLDITRYCSTVVISGCVGCEKPEPEIFRLALERAGVAPQDALHVGDSLAADVEGARAAGITPVLLDRYGRHRDQPANGYSRITSLHELPPIVDAHGARA